MYEMLFSHPLVEAITGWDFADGAWLHAPSGLIREDNTPKPSYYALKKLIHEDWSSKGILHTDENGIATLEGFRGEYAFASGNMNAKAKLQKNTSEVISVMIQ